MGIALIIQMSILTPATLEQDVKMLLEYHNKKLEKKAAQERNKTEAAEARKKEQAARELWKAGRFEREWNSFWKGVIQMAVMCAVASVIWDVGRGALDMEIGVRAMSWGGIGAVIMFVFGVLMCVPS